MISIVGFIASVLVIISAVVAVALWIKNTLSDFKDSIHDFDKRLIKLETTIQTYWEPIKPFIAVALMGKAPQNPMSNEKWDSLLNKLAIGTLTPQEAVELQEAFKKKEEEAKQQKDLITLLAIGLGLALLAMIIGNKN